MRLPVVALVVLAGCITIVPPPEEDAAGNSDCPRVEVDAPAAFVAGSNLTIDVRFVNCSDRPITIVGGACTHRLVVHFVHSADGERAWWLHDDGVAYAGLCLAHDKETVPSGHSIVSHQRWNGTRQMLCGAGGTCSGAAAFGPALPGHYEVRVGVLTEGGRHFSSSTATRLDPAPPERP